MPNGKPREGVSPNRLGSKARCDALIGRVEQILRFDDHSFQTDFCFVLTARYSEENWEDPSGISRNSLSDQMARYIYKNSLCKQIIAKPEAWGTYQETKTSIRRILGIRNGQVHNENPNIFVSTNLGHMPRVWLCWLFLRPRGWKIHFVLADHSFTKKEWLQETVKFFTYLYRFVFKKW